MASTLTDIFRVLKEIRDKESPSVGLAVRRGSTVVDLRDVTASLNNLLTELQSQSTTLSTLALQTAVDGVEGLLTTIRNNADGVEALLTTIRNNADGVEALLTTIDTDVGVTAQVRLPAIEVLLTTIRDNADGVEGILTTIDADTGAMTIDLAAIETLITAGNVDLAAMEALLITIRDNADGVEGILTTIDADTGAMVIDLAAIEVLLTTIRNNADGVEAGQTTNHGKLDDIISALNSPNASGDEWLGKISGSLSALEAINQDIEDALKQPITGLDWGGLILIDTTAQLVLLATIDADTNAVRNSTDAIEAVAEEDESDVFNNSIIDTHTTCTIRPAVAETLKIVGLDLTNDTATARTAIVYLSNGTVHTRIQLVPSLGAAGGAFLFGPDSEIEIRRDLFIRIVFSAAADASGYSIDYGHINLVGQTDPVFTSIA